MATFKGFNGSFTTGGNAVANIRSWSLNVETQELDITKFGQVWETKEVGIGRWSGTLVAQFDYGDTSGQKALVDKLVATTPAATSQALVFQVATSKTLSGSAFLTALSIPQELNGIVEITFSFVGTGALTPSWA